MENKKNMKKNKILITGGLGFIGSHCVELWDKLGYEITIIDNLSSNALPKEHSIFNNCNIIINDLLDVDYKTLNNFDIILHLASPVGPVGVLKHSGKMASIIIDDIYWAIKVAKHNNAPLIFVSTSEIYGHRETKTYLKENDYKKLIGEYTVRNEYSIAKLLSEIAIVNNGKIDESFKYQIIRPFNVTGKYQLPDGGFVLPRFVEQALNGDNITVYYDGLQVRAFTWVKDIVDGIYLTSTAPNEFWNQEWNIGNEVNEETILYLAEKVKNICNSNSDIVHIDPTLLHGKLFSEAPEKIPNSEKIKSNLGWNPTKGIDEIIQEVINYYK
jgi:nucleoside-diphosphate-sugar epimerase